MHGNTIDNLIIFVAISIGIIIFRLNLETKIIMNVIKQNTNTEITSLLEDLKNHLTLSIPGRLKKIILFGSYARGDYEKDSDVDVLVILEDENLYSYNSFFSELELKLFSKYDLLVSIIPVNLMDFARNQDRLPFYKIVNSEGIQLYG